jgi:hypothetical protein
MFIDKGEKLSKIRLNYSCLSAPFSATASNKLDYDPIPAYFECKGQSSYYLKGNSGAYEAARSYIASGDAEGSQKQACSIKVRLDIV